MLPVPKCDRVALLEGRYLQDLQEFLRGSREREGAVHGSGEHRLGAEAMIPG